MTFTKEQISQAFIEVLNERVPDLSNIPDHTFSEHFEKNMNKLIKKEAEHPWAVSHVAARNLIVAATVIILLFTMCMSVSAIRNKIFNFFLQHFTEHDNVVFDLPEKTQIEKDYIISDLPEGFSLKEEFKSEMNIMRSFENEKGDYIHFSQNLFIENGIAVDNERSKYEFMELDGCGVFTLTTKDNVTFSWDQDGYVFLLTVHIENVTVDDATVIFNSILPVD